MIGVEIRDMRPDRSLAFDLAEVLDAIGPVVDQLSWRCSAVECTGEGAAELHRLSDNRQEVDGAHLRRMASRVQQVIDGEFVATAAGGGPVLLVRAVDSSLWEVFGEESVLQRIRQTFRAVQPAQGGELSCG